MTLSKASTSDPAVELLTLVRTLVEELHPNLEHQQFVTLDVSLERDLGIDSLSRMELLRRIESHFGTAISEQAVSAADTPRDLLRVVGTSNPAIRAESQTLEVFERNLVTDESKPEQAATLVETLQWHATQHPDRVHMHFYDDDHQPHAMTYGTLHGETKKAAQGLLKAGVQPGDAVALMLPSALNYFYVFMGIQMIGGVPVPIYPPIRASQIEDHVARHAKILDNARVTTLVTFGQVKALAVLLRARAPMLDKILTPEDLLNVGTVESPPPIGADDVAFLQYTSGSTGNPKGVVLTHANILANIRAMDRALQTHPNDVFVSWLPLYHDMGLIGAWLGSLYVGFTLVLMSPLGFLSRPYRWLQAIHQHRGTISGGPNFSYELCFSRIADADIEGLDLSSWRYAFNGAEPVSADTMRRFTQRFEPFGFSARAVAPVYGLAEATLGVGFPPVNRGLLVDVVSRETLAREGRAQPMDAGDPDAIEIVACGQPMPGYQVRITDEAGRELPDRYQGRLEFKGPSTTGGYFRNPEATRTLFRDGWLDSGDLAYVADGDIYITSRVKDMIIRAGRNIYPYELEEAVGDLQGIRKGCVALFATPDANNQTEKLILVAETRETDADTRAGLQTQIAELATELLGVPLDHIRLAPPRSVLKTSSGKIRRSATSEAFQKGDLGAGGRSVGLQVARLAVGGIVPQAKRFWRRLREWAYATWLWTCVGLCAALAATATIVLPSLDYRWDFIRRLAQIMGRVSALPIEVTGLEHLPREQPFVLVSNHQSYMDAPVLSGVLPIVVSYVAKAELRSNPILGPLLKRLGVSFVDRLDKQQSLVDAKAIDDVLASGLPVAFFVEGTLRRMPGLLPFQMGAFVSAVNNNVPVVPVTIRGTRSVLRDESWFPRRGRIRVHIGEPIEHDTKARPWAAAVDLRDRARKEILRWVAEPDLIGHRVTTGPEPNDQDS